MIEIPPMAVVNVVEARAPGVYNYFVWSVVKAAQRWGGTAGLSSWWRSYTNNIAVHGHPDSQHLIGLAADLYPADEDLVAELNRAGLVALNQSSHIHVQLWSHGTARRAGLLDAIGV